ncbi:MAG TPA: amidohydrolase family protein [Thermoanaerobaculia bacterium]|nr:amidohydrolase family protein [Thermoanaerobaculia bacterium]
MNPRVAVMALLLPMLLTECRHGSPLTAEASIVAIVGASVIPMTSPDVLTDQTILLRGERIVAVAPRTMLRVPKGARTIDARGLFVIPGLSDMHVHTRDEDMPLFLANGITTVREMNGTPTLLALRDAIARRERLGPTLIVAGPLLAGEKQRWRHLLISSPEEASSEVQREIRAGYDEIKIYSGLSRQAWEAIAREAARGGKRFVGHVPKSVGIEDAVAWGQTTIEHTETIAQNAPDAAHIGRLVTLLHSHRTWFTPTLGVELNIGMAGTAEYASRYESVPVDLVDPAIRAWWESLKQPRDHAPDPRYRQAKQLFVLAAAEGGVPMLLGTDCPNPLCVPGYGLHEETRALQEAGLSPYTILEMATKAPAAYLRKDGEFGVVAPGARADLVLLRSNPLDDIANLRHVEGVVVRGRHLDRTSLEQGVERVRALLRERERP